MDQPRRDRTTPNLVRPYLPPERDSGPLPYREPPPVPPPPPAPAPPPHRQPVTAPYPHRDAAPPPPQVPSPERTAAPSADGVTGIRPYLLTSGRVRPIDETLEIEAQVFATPRGTASKEQLAFEHRDIVELCACPVSVAEIAARLGLHIGVTRVLVSDLAAFGYLSVTRPRPGAHRDVDTIERVIRGLESLR